MTRTGTRDPRVAPPNRPLAWSLIVGGVAGVSAFIVSGVILLWMYGWEPGALTRGVGAGDPFAPLVVTAPLGSFLVGMVLWFVFVERPNEAGSVRGGIVGGVIAIAAHPLMWTGSNVAMLARNAAGVGADPVTLAVIPFSALVGGISMALWSLLLFGWATVPVGAGIGAALGTLRQRSLAARAVDGDR